MKKLIRQIRSLGSLFKEYGVHVPHYDAGKPKISFRAPTYLIGGSDSSFTRQGGFISEVSKVTCPVIIRQVFNRSMFLKKDTHKIKGFEYRLESARLWLNLLSFMINLYKEPIPQLYS